jgi:hypothetical protein
MSAASEHRASQLYGWRAKTALGWSREYWGGSVSGERMDKAVDGAVKIEQEITLFLLPHALKTHVVSTLGKKAQDSPSHNRSSGTSQAGHGVGMKLEAAVSKQVA